MDSMDKFCEIVARLRAEDGCPWDREQTHSSLKPGCIEEAAEVICGINILEQTGNADNLREELGDVLLQVVFHDLKGDVTNKIETRADKVIFADGKYAPCQGCFKCWTKHPATCMPPRRNGGRFQ